MPTKNLRTLIVPFLIENSAHFDYACEAFTLWQSRQNRSQWKQSGTIKTGRNRGIFFVEFKNSISEEVKQELVKHLSFLKINLIPEEK